MDIVSLSQKIYSQINKAQNILLIAHQGPDADAMGSLMALSHWLENLGKNHTRFCLTQPATNLSWLLNFEPLNTEIKVSVSLSHFVYYFRFGRLSLRWSRRNFS